jgi:hypothetical protein
LFVGGVFGSTERAVASHCDQVGASRSRFIQSKWISGERMRSARSIRLPTFASRSGLRTG